MSERCLCEDFELRGQTYEIWRGTEGNYLADPRSQMVVDTDRAFSPPLTNDELLQIYDYGKDY